MSDSAKRARATWAKLGGAIVAIAIAVVLRSLGVSEDVVSDVTRSIAPSQQTAASQPAAPSRYAGSDADARIEAAVRDQRSGFMITVEGEVLKVLRDDNEGSRHQRLLIELSTGRTLLIAHNIDLAPRVPCQRGDRLRVHGQYEWNDKGGVLHWTHHDPDGSHEEGWIEHRGKRYG